MCKETDKTARVYTLCRMWRNIKGRGIPEMLCGGFILLGFLALACAQSPPAPSAAPTVAPSPTHRLKVSEMNTSQLVLEKVPPKYPDASLRAGTEGAVVLEVGIDALGVVQDVTVISGDPILAKAATDAVAQWKYKPYLLDGSAIDIETQVTVNFHIANRTPPSARRVSRRHVQQRIFQHLLSPFS